MLKKMRPIIVNAAVIWRTDAARIGAVKNRGDTSHTARHEPRQALALPVLPLLLDARYEEATHH